MVRLRLVSCRSLCSSGFTHLHEVSGSPRMVSVGDKQTTQRAAVAACRVKISPKLHALLLSGAGQVAKGNALTVAELAGVMGAKRAADLIPLCHPLPLTGASASVTVNSQLPQVDVVCTVECSGPTGVEMESLTGCSLAALALYDMCKSVDKSMMISDLRLLKKTGGKSGDFCRDDGNDEVAGTSENTKS